MSKVKFYWHLSNRYNFVRFVVCTEPLLTVLEWTGLDQSVGSRKSELAVSEA
jgi:hypothetical protein